MALNLDDTKTWILMDISQTAIDNCNWPAVEEALLEMGYSKEEINGVWEEFTTAAGRGGAGPLIGE